MLILKYVISAPKKYDSDHVSAYFLIFVGFFWQ